MMATPCVHIVSMVPVERKGQFHMRLSQGEENMLRALADAEGLTASDLVRQMIRRAFMEKWPPKVRTRK
jgi:hypothetical protein